jgi:hypothetical protein
MLCVATSRGRGSLRVTRAVGLEEWFDGLLEVDDGVHSYWDAGALSISKRS